ncbi:hypothetical protein [Flavobacterium crassostreae]|uniref:hypothetical protein n=1 Tax=Flavobacterium crassostreae TaxID=1763534 RepID=UPI00159EE475|nr:hypothetical protein [Flavobacterium crassostreae]
MKNKLTTLLTLITVAFTFTSCEVIGGIFKAGMGVGIFMVIAIIALVLFGVAKLFGKK